MAILSFGLERIKAKSQKSTQSYQQQPLGRVIRRQTDMLATEQQGRGEKFFKNL